MTNPMPNGSLVRNYHPNLTAIAQKQEDNLFTTLRPDLRGPATLPPPAPPASPSQPRPSPSCGGRSPQFISSSTSWGSPCCGGALFTNSYIRLSQALMIDWQATLKQWLTWNQMPFSQLVLCALCTLDQRGAWLRWPTEISENMKSDAKGWNSRDFETWV